MNSPRLTDFAYDDMMQLCLTLDAALQNDLKNIEFLMRKFPTSDLIDYYQSRADKHQRLYTQASQACIELKVIENIKSN